MENRRNQTMHRYEIIIFWSNDDEAFVADVPELPGCEAHGNTPQDARSNAQEAMELRFKTGHEFGDPVQEPREDAIQPRGVSS